MRRIAVLDAPSNLGLRPPTATSVPGCAKAPGALRDHGLVSRLGARDAGCLTPPRYDPGDWRPGDGVAHAAEIAAYSRALADRIGAIIDGGEFPVVLGGDCSILIGSGLAMHRLGEAVGGRIGLVFVDGHSDFRHPGNASYVGAAAGEDLALVTGRGQADLAAIERRRPYFRDVDVVVLGIRAQDEYRLDLQAAGIVTRPVPALRAEGAARSAQWARDQLVDCAGYWVHMDVDVLDPAVMPAVDAPDPGGIAFPELELLLSGLVESPHCLGVEITVFDPDYDPDGRYAAEIASAVVAGLAPVKTTAPRPDLVAARRDLAGGRPASVLTGGESPAGQLLPDPAGLLLPDGSEELGPPLPDGSEESGPLLSDGGDGPVLLPGGGPGSPPPDAGLAPSPSGGGVDRPGRGDADEPVSPLLDGADEAVAQDPVVASIPGPQPPTDADEIALDTRGATPGVESDPRTRLDVPGAPGPDGWPVDGVGDDVAPEAGVGGGVAPGRGVDDDAATRLGFGGGAGPDLGVGSGARAVAGVGDDASPETGDGGDVALRLGVEGDAGPGDDAAAGPNAEDDAAVGFDAEGDAAVGFDAEGDAAVGFDAEDDAAVGFDAEDDAAAGPNAEGDAAAGLDAEDDTVTRLSVEDAGAAGDTATGRTDGAPDGAPDSATEENEATSDPAGDISGISDTPEDADLGNAVEDEPVADYDVAVRDAGRAAVAGPAAERPGVRLVPRPLGSAPLLDSEPLPATRPGMLRPRPPLDPPVAGALHSPHPDFPGGGAA